MSKLIETGIELERGPVLHTLEVWYNFFPDPPEFEISEAWSVTIGDWIILNRTEEDTVIKLIRQKIADRNLA